MESYIRNKVGHHNRMSLFGTIGVVSETPQHAYDPTISFDKDIYGRMDKIKKDAKTDDTKFLEDIEALMREQPDNFLLILKILEMNYISTFNRIRDKMVRFITPTGVNELD